jgi:hypothetical protein
VFAQSHAGGFPLDALFVGLGIRRAAGPCRTPFYATAEAALALPALGPLLRRVGAVPARWRVVFHPPVRLDAEPRALLADGARSAQVALEVERTVRRTLESRARRDPLAHVSSWIAARRPAAAAARDALHIS